MGVVNVSVAGCKIELFDKDELRGVRQDRPGVDDRHHQGVRREPLRAPGRDGEAGPEDGRHQGHPAAPGGVEHRRQGVAGEGEGRLRQPAQGPGPQARGGAAARRRTRARGPEGRLRGHERDHRRAAEDRSPPRTSSRRPGARPAPTACTSPRKATASWASGTGRRWLVAPGPQGRRAEAARKARADADDVLQPDLPAELPARQAGAGRDGGRAGAQGRLAVAGGQAAAVPRTGGRVGAVARGGVVHVPLGGHGVGEQGRRGDLAAPPAQRPRPRATRRRS